MSFTFQDAAAKTSRASGTARAILFILAWHADADGYSYPEEERLAREAGCTVRSVRRSLHTLEALGELRVERGTGRGHRNQYYVTVPTVREKGTGKGDTVSGKGTSATGKGGHPVQERGTSATPLHMEEEQPVEQPVERSSTDSDTAPPAQQGIINAYLLAVGQTPARLGPNGRRKLNGEVDALLLCDASPADVASCTRWLAGDPWYVQRAIAPPLDHVATHFAGWERLGRPATWTTPEARKPLSELRGGNAMTAVFDAMEAGFPDDRDRTQRPALVQDGIVEADFRLASGD